ncbi:neutral amino acid permease [Fusarium beomiforme]|uniref:Neutral amino acid permease n=1 Tax=Fusarium beomiforme TaxID=44412 RepID=A0A9P5AFV0_9HYPO|nr:neutral amino acid permease [Fusarium beomiforme]
MATSIGDLKGKAIAFGANADEEMAGGDSSKINQALDMNDIVRYLDQAQSKDNKASEKYGTVKNIFNRTLECIQTVGGIVADGTSYVFAPAGTCYNALTFVIQAWQGYEGIFESLASLLEECIEFLERLTYYVDSGMDSKLTKLACQHLQIFVDICDHTLRLRSKRSKFTAFMRQMFLNDDGVQDLLGAMKNLIEKEHGLLSAQTWKSSNEAAVNLRDGLSLTRNMHASLVDDRNQKQLVESTEESLSHLEKVFVKLMKDKEWQSERGHNGILARVIYNLGDKYWEDGERQEEAITTYSKILDIERSIYIFSGFPDVLQKYSAAGCWEAMVEFFERLLDEPDGPNTAGEFLMNNLLMPVETFFALFAKFIDKSARLDFLEALFVRAIARATFIGDRDDLFTIRYYYGKTLFSIKGQEEAGIAIWELYKNEATNEIREQAVNSIDAYTVPAWLELATIKDIDPARAQRFFDKIETAYTEFEALESHDIEPTIAKAEYTSTVAMNKRILN